MPFSALNCFTKCIRTTFVLGVSILLSCLMQPYRGALTISLRTDKIYIILHAFVGKERTEKLKKKKCRVEGKAEAGFVLHRQNSYPLFASQHSPNTCHSVLH